MANSIITATDFAYLARVLQERCAMVLEPGKEYLVLSRLTPIVGQHGLKNIEELLIKLRGPNSEKLITEVVEAMVTNETSFFRDVHPFESLKTTILPQLIQLRRSQRALNIWCAASSSGQEPYSIAILIKDHFPELSGWQLNLTATDISHEMLNRSRVGRYSQAEVNRGLPPSVLLKWFRQEGEVWQLDEQVRNMVTFSHLNLAQPWPTMPTWDVILLRNVMIYFDNEVKKNILNRVARVIHREGYLLLGGTETTFNLNDSFSRVERTDSSYFQLKPSP